MTTPRRRVRGRRGIAGALVCTAALVLPAAACGKKGPPLPPLIRLPAAPLDVAVARRGLQVEVTLTVPNANTDGFRPGDIDRVEVFALTTPDKVTANDVIAGGARVASLDVKSPRNPDDPLDEDDPESETKLLEPTGLDQGGMTHVTETLAVSDLTGDATRVYAAVAVSTRGRRGPASSAIAVPLAEAPPSPAEALVTYDDKAITITWEALATESVDGYHVYEQPPAPAEPEADEATTVDRRLTMELLTEPSFADPRVEWGTERCYRVRAVRVIDAFGVESEPSPATCVTPVDTFPPPRPTNVDVVANVGAISIVWDASPAPDLAGYVVLRGAAPATTLEPITPTPIVLTRFVDTVPSGTRYVYAVQAVDTNGNRSEPSARVEESAR